MQDVSKEWLDFRRNQFPAGSRIQTWELDDPRNTLKEMAAGQASDGFGEGFEQRPIDAGGRELFAHLWQCENWEIQTEQEWFGQTQAQESHDNGAPAEAQRSGVGGERSSGEMSEPCPQGEAKGMERGMTMGGMSL